jgi:hypothetical protein
VSEWLLGIKQILDETGLSHIWLSQGQNTTTELLKINVKQILMDQFQQCWTADVFDGSKCDNYRIFKSKFGFENYLVTLSPKLRELFTKFRCRNHKLPIEIGVYTGVVKEERICAMCNELGDEFHYIFSCNQFQQQRVDFLNNYYRHHISTLKMEQLFNCKGAQLYKLCKLIKVILHDIK